MEKDLRQVSSHILRVVLYGPESTGKTTLAQALANHFQTEWVQEFARDYLQKKWEEQQAVCTLEDLPIIVAGSGGGALRTGLHVHSPEGTPLANLWLTQARAMGLNLERFADSQGEVSALRIG